MNKKLRVSPSAGARYPLEIYPLIFSAKDLDCGIYHYNVKSHSLELLKKGDFKSQFFKCVGQDMILKCSMLIVISAIFNRTKDKYGERGYRYVLLDAGHLAQNAYLIATRLSLGCCTIGGFLDNEINKLLKIDGLTESSIYLIAIGTL